VEQKNWTHVRELLGYDRLDKPQLVDLVNRLYHAWGLLHNFFSPNLPAYKEWCKYLLYNTGMEFTEEELFEIGGEGLYPGDQVINY
jgi:hypothetical protein